MQVQVVHKNGLLFDGQLYLTNAFVDAAFVVGDVNRLGPLEIIWMDDPSTCRPGLFSKIAPTSPVPLDGTTSRLNAVDLYCHDNSPRPLPRAWPQPYRMSMCFDDVNRLLSSNEVESFERLSRQYLRLHGILLEQLLVREQRVQIAPDKNSTATVHISQAVVGEITSNPSLIIELEFQAWNGNEIVTILSKTSDEYLAFLAANIDAFKSPIQGISSTNTEWKTSYIAIAMTLLAVIVVSLHRCRPCCWEMILASDDISSQESENGWRSQTSLEDNLVPHHQQGHNVVDKTPSHMIHRTLIYL